MIKIVDGNTYHITERVDIIDGDEIHSCTECDLLVRITDTGEEPIIKTLNNNTVYHTGWIETDPIPDSFLD